MLGIHISLNTVTAYRTAIRKKFLRLPAQQRPVWMLVWLWRFPGAVDGRLIHR